MKSEWRGLKFAHALYTCTRPLVLVLDRYVCSRTWPFMEIASRSIGHLCVSSGRGSTRQAERAFVSRWRWPLECQPVWSTMEQGKYYTDTVQCNPIMSTRSKAGRPLARLHLWQIMLCWTCCAVFHRCRYTKLGFAGNTEPQFIIPSCKFIRSFVQERNFLLIKYHQNNMNIMTDHIP